jgi:hypothetical protein
MVDVASADRSACNGGPKIIGEEEIVADVVDAETPVLVGVIVVVAIPTLEVLAAIFFDVDVGGGGVSAPLVAAASPDEDACAANAGGALVIIVVVSVEITVEVVSANATEIGHHK